MKVPYVIDGLYGYAISSERFDFHGYIKNKLGSEPMIYEELELQGITKILILKFDLRIKTDLEKIIGREEIKLTINHHKLEGFVDLVAENTNKFYAAIEMGVDLACTAVFGNDLNDIMLLKNAYLPYIVGSQLDTHVDFPHTKIESVSVIQIFYLYKDVNLEQISHAARCLCFLIQSLSASSMRVCQPSPVSLK